MTNDMAFDSDEEIKDIEKMEQVVHVHYDHSSAQVVGWDQIWAIMEEEDKRKIDFDSDNYTDSRFPNNSKELPKETTPVTQPDSATPADNSAAAAVPT